MINLENTTFIIPLKIEHPDRYRNAKTVLNFMNQNLKTNVFIYESSDNGESRLDFLKELKNLNIKIWNIVDEEIFHRTKYLNIMLDEVKTEIVVNYDIDVILDPENIKKCCDMISQDEADVIYPYEFGNGQIQVFQDPENEIFIDGKFVIDDILKLGRINSHTAECGHCIFFKTDFYRRFGGENELFISYGPEDKERMHRFKKISDKVLWMPGEKVYHFEHHRGKDSSHTNPNFYKNWEIYNNLISMEKNSIIEYYKNIEYLGKYKTIGKNE